MQRPGRRLRISPILVACVAVLVVAAAIVGTTLALRGHSVTPPTMLPVAARSANPPQTGYVWVQYTGGRYARAQISGKAKGATTGEVARLYAQQWPFNLAPAPVGRPVALQPEGNTATASYTFRVTPTLATRYRVEVFATATARIVLARTATTTVYVAYYATAQSPPACARPICNPHLSINVFVPPSAISFEITKPWYVYFGLTLSGSSATPSPPTALTMDAGGARAGNPTQLSADEFSVPVMFYFSVGKDGYNWLWNACMQDTEAIDGLGLPGTHGCGTNTVPATTVYLG
jgi:hypothetical protein